jgi:hypothetical protein
MVDCSGGVGVDEFYVSDPPGGAGLAKGKSHMFRRDHVDLARVVCRDPDQGAAVIGKHGIRVHIATGEHEGHYPTMLGPTHGTSRGRAVGPEGASRDVQGPTAAQPWIYPLSLSRMRKKGEAENERESWRIAHTQITSGVDCGRWTQFKLYLGESKRYLLGGYCCPYKAERY